MIKKFLDLGMQPLANKYLTKKDIIKKNKEQFYHLEVGFNSKSLAIVSTDISTTDLDGILYIIIGMSDSSFIDSFIMMIQTFLCRFVIIRCYN